MDPGELNSKSHGRNVFDPGNLGHSLFGATAPNSASLYAHYAHLPNSLSLLTHPSAFPAQLNLTTPAFGGLGSLTAPAMSTAYTSPPGAAWWPMASRLLAPDYLMRSLVASTTNTTFVGLSRDSVLPGYDVLSQQPPPPHHPLPHKINSEYKSSSRRKASSSLSSSPSLSTENSSASRHLESSFSSPIYTRPSTGGVTITHVGYDKKSSDNLMYQQNGGIMTPLSTSSGSSATTSVSSDTIKSRLNLSDRPSFMPSPGVHMLPVTVITKESGATALKASRGHNSPKNIHLEPVLKEGGLSESKGDCWEKSLNFSGKHDEKITNSYKKCNDRVCGSDDVGSASPKLSKLEGRPKENSDKIDVNKGLDALPSNNQVEDSVSMSRRDSLDSSAESTSTPLNLSLKSHDRVSSPPPLIPKPDLAASKRKKTRPKSKSLGVTMASLEPMMDHMYSQDELRAHLEAQLKRQQYQLKMAKRLAAQNDKATERSHQATITSLPSLLPIHSPSMLGKLKSPTLDHHFSSVSGTSTLSPNSSPSTSSASMTVSSATKGISLLTGAPAILSSQTEAMVVTCPSTSSQSPLLTSAKSRLMGSPMATPPECDLTRQLPSLDTPQKSESLSSTKDGIHVSANGPLDDPKKLVAKFRTLKDSSDDDSSVADSSDESESSTSSSDSESESDSSDTEDTERSQTTSTASTPVSSLLKGQKRSHHNDHSGTSSPSIKRRRLIIEETELRIPLEHGWRRQTKIRTFSYSGVRGTVTYFAPCGKKLKTYPEVIRYLDKNMITDITRENFSFSTKVNIGEFLEPIETANAVEYVSLGEQEVIARIREIRACKGRRRSSYRTDSKRTDEDKLKSADDTQLHHKSSHHGDAVHRPARDRKGHRRGDREKAAIAAKEAKKMKVMEAKQRKEHLRILRQQEKYERQEQIRLEKEMRAQQMLEARKKRQEELEKQRVEEAMRKAKERELKRQQAVFLKVQELQKRREMLIMVDLERERRRQHMLLVKALEAHKKQEERERIREEKKTEKRLTKERKMEQRKLELEALRELRKPVEDMEIADPEPLPTLNRIPGVKLPGKAFADILMVIEFLHNFGETLGFDMQNLLTLNTLQMAMLNNECAEEELISTLHHLLTCAIEDPGPPINTKHLSLLSQSLKEVDITGYTISEVLRIFIQAFAGVDCSMSQWLKERPYLSLNPTQKASILAFVCNELLCSRAICRQIDTSIEAVTCFRKDKWMIEGKLRKLKTIQNKKFNRSSNKCDEADGEKEEKRSSKNSSPIKGTKGGDEEVVNESGNESEGSQMTGHGDGEQDEQEEEEMGMSPDELKKQIDKLGKQMNFCRGKLAKSTQRLRAMSFGQDRYKRRYWVLPYAGGLFVEGMESTEIPEEMVLSSENQEENITVKEEEKESQFKVESHCEDKIMKDVSVIKSEPIDEHTKFVDVDDNGSCLSDKREPTKRTKVKEDPDHSEITKPKLGKGHEEVALEDNLFLRKPEELGKLSDYLSDCAANSSSAASSRPPSEKNQFSLGQIPPSVLFNGPLNSSVKGLHDYLPSYIKSDGGIQNHLFNDKILDSSPFSLPAEHMLKPINDKMVGKPWFSLLPRMPCDETTLTRLHGLPPSSKVGNHSKYSSPFPYSPFNMYGNAPSFATLQMGVINGAISSMMNVDHQAHISPRPHATDSPSINNHIHPNSSTPCTDISSIAASDISWDLGVDKLKTYPEAKPIPIELQRGWWRITDANQLKTIMKALHQRGFRERMLYKQFEKYEDFACQACGKGKENAVDLEISELDRKISQSPGGAPEAEEPTSWSRDVALRVDLTFLEHVEALEERLINSSMQVKNWKPAPKASVDDSVTYRPACIPEDNEGSCVSPVDVARQRLLELEQHIEPRYIKPPLGYSTPDLNLSNLSNNSNSSSSGEAHSPVPDDVPPRLLHWREAVHKVRTSAQLAMCLSLLESCIAWDKSIMKASCQFCNSGDNEAMLLLCDGCDKGYHMYCFKPKMDSIPDGDWFCNECINKATGDRVCMVCSKKGKNLCVCDSCPKAYHIDCLDPPLSRLPKGKWLCSHCNQKPVKSKSKSGNSSGSSHSKKRDTGSNKKEEMSDDMNSKMDRSRSEKQTASADKQKSDRLKERTKTNRDLAPCRSILGEMESHEDAWPFLLPVNTKQFPSYRKVIKKQMDFSTIRGKLSDGSYKSREDFMADTRLIFDNCETFNEDDSPVGKAGHNMRAFFETRWSELAGN